jgi:methionine-rich copper-binding protein CopC
MKTLTANVIGLLALISSLAFAHTQLSTSMPNDKAVLKTAPAEVALQFSEDVRLTALSVEKHGGAAQDLQPLPTESGRDFSVPAPDLGEGIYMVKWRAVGADTHVISGEFMYTVSANATAPHAAAAMPMHTEAHSEMHSEAPAHGH